MNEFMDAHPEMAASVIPLTNVDNETLRALYSAAELLLFPSLEEGFGWPIVEAQACGCRVVTSQKAPMTEAGGDAAFYLPEREHGSIIHEWLDVAVPVVEQALSRMMLRARTWWPAACKTRHGFPRGRWRSDVRRRLSRPDLCP